jgi:hypothetical protein
LNASPPHQRCSKGVVRSTNNFLTASSDMRLFHGEPRVLEGFSMMAYFAIFSIHSCMFL